jgi:lipase chaperone LimK
MKRESTLPSQAPAPRRRALALLLLIGGFALAAWLISSTNSPQQPPAAAVVDAREQRRTIAQSWQWQPTTRTPAEPRSKPAAIGRISPAAVVQALGRVQFDADGKVVIDRNARDVLEDSLQALPNLTEEELDALGRTLRAGLPGPQGERAARIVADYYRYRAALQEFEGTAQTAATAENERTRLNEIAKLRDEYLGPVVARQFFAEDQALQRYVLESRTAGADGAALQRDLQDGLFYLDSRTSPQARELGRQMAALRSQGASEEHAQYVQLQQLGLYTADALPRPPDQQADWQQRSDQFKRERQAVLTAGLTEEDKKTQIEQLLRQYFKPEELEAIRAYNVR